MEVQKRTSGFVYDVYGTRPVFNNEGTHIRTEFLIYNYGWEWVDVRGYEPVDGAP